MKIINLDQIKQITADISETLASAKVPHLVSGSLAFKLLTGDDASKVNDVDIIVYQKDFEQIMGLLKEKGLPLNLIPTPYSIHANHNTLLGNDEQPFDWVLDSYERYYEGKNGLTLNDFTNYQLGDKNIHLISKEGLIKVYEIALAGSNIHKYPAYRDKITKLEKVDGEVA